ncbi:Peptidase M28 [Sphingomonas antarctica]|uniref:M28 family metallopeptidase n=1 Tax=Sphingomonas antarctica TaxID=2040274 RepID=UPI0039EBB2AD
MSRQNVTILSALLLTAMPVAAQNSAPIDPARMSDVVRTLAADDFQGRAPGTPGEDKTVAYLSDQFAKAGLAPAGENGTFVQTVPLIRTRIGSPATISIATPGGTIALNQSQQAYFSTVRDVSRLTIAKAPLVFVGYGVHAPERQWDDFKGVDLKGKVAIFLVNDPDFEAVAGEPVANTFGGKRMTYYGRWTYKYEEAARRGAIAALIVDDTAGAGYGWSTVIAPQGENYDIVRAPGDYRVLLQGWLEGEAARTLFTKSGLDLDKLRIAARRADFRPVPLSGAALSVDAPVAADHVQSRNLIGKIAGTAHADETIMFGAHWDAYGVGSPDATGRTVRAGAADDAIGVAGVLELARAFAKGPKTQRTLLFSAWTGEERGLLGSEHYAAHPLYPLDKTVANLTMDVLQTAGPARDVVLVGNGQSDLEDRVAAAATKQGRTITPEALPERGLFFRADHFSFARRGVPSLLLMGMSGGHDLVTGGRAAGDAWLTDYMKCYHQACDVWKQSWDLRGAAQDVALLYGIGSSLANSRDWPDWRPGTEFKAMREKSVAARQ